MHCQRKYEAVAVISVMSDCVLVCTLECLQLMTTKCHMFDFWLEITFFAFCFP